jgi:hypothetical protein
MCILIGARSRQKRNLDMELDPIPLPMVIGIKGGWRDLINQKSFLFGYFASRQKRQEYNWRIIDNWAFRSSVFGPNKCKSLVCFKRRRQAF